MNETSLTLARDGKSPLAMSLTEKLNRMWSMIGDPSQVQTLAEYQSANDLGNTDPNQFVIDMLQNEETQLFHTVIMGPLTDISERDPLVNQFFANLEETLIRAGAVVDVVGIKEYLSEKVSITTNDPVERAISIRGNLLEFDMNKIQNPLSPALEGTEITNLSTDILPQKDLNNNRTYSLPIPSSSRFVLNALNDKNYSLAEAYNAISGHYDKDLNWLSSGEYRNEVSRQVHMIENTKNDLVKIGYLDYIMSHIRPNSEINKFREQILNGDTTLAYNLENYMNSIKPGDRGAFDTSQAIHNLENGHSVYRVVSLLRETRDSLSAKGDFRIDAIHNMLHPDLSKRYTAEEEEEIMKRVIKPFDGSYNSAGMFGILPRESKNNFTGFVRKHILNMSANGWGKYFDSILNRSNKVTRADITLYGPIPTSIIFFSPSPGNWGVSVFIANPRDERIKSITTEEFLAEHHKIVDGWQTKMLPNK